MTIAIRESFPYRYDEVGSLLRPEKLKGYVRIIGVNSK